MCGCAKDVFFYSLVYDNQQKSLIADHGEIRVGLRYQVEIIPDKLESRMSAPAACNLIVNVSNIHQRPFNNLNLKPLPVLLCFHENSNLIC